MIPEPHQSVEDTQPTQPLLTLDDTQPSPAITLLETPSQIRLILLGVIILISLSIVVTLSMIAQSPITTASVSYTEPLPISVTLLVDGVANDIETTLETVEALLIAENITYSEQDDLSVPFDAPLLDGMIIRLNHQREVELVINGTARQLQTVEQQPLDILSEADVAINIGDRIWVDGTEVEHTELATYPLLPQAITIKAAIPITIIDSNEETTFWTAADTVGDALFESGITLYASDTITPDLSTELAEGQQITILRGQPVSIEVDGTTIETHVQGAVVADALAESGVALVGLDYTIPDESASVVPGMIIRVLRVTEEIISEQETLPYDTIYDDDAALELDTLAIRQAGQTGIVDHTIRIRYENGFEISREVIDSTIQQPMMNEVIAYGTNIVLRTIDTPEGPREYWRVLRLYATSYKPESVGGNTTTAIGMTLEKGVVGAHPSIIPYRTQLFVPGYGVGVMGDTGYGLSGTRYWIDLGYSDDNFVNWHENVDVYLLTPIPENINYLLPRP